MIVTLKETIPSGSHNAPYDSETGYHWPAGARFKLLSKTRQSNLRKFYGGLTGKVILEQVGGEEVYLAIPADKLQSLFGVEA